MVDIIVGFIINIVNAALIIVMAYWIANRADKSDRVTGFACVVAWAFAICLAGCSMYDFLTKIFERV